MITRRELLRWIPASAAVSVLGTGLASAAEAGPSITLAARTRTIEVGGKAASVYGLVQPSGVHGLVASAGTRFRVRLENRLDTKTLVHWHGLTPPYRQDGVPGISQPALEPGLAYDYDFPLDRPGTFWMHSHQGLQKQQLLAAPLIVRDPADAGRDEQEVVMFLHDFSFRDPEDILAELTGGRARASGHGAMHSSPPPVVRMDHGAHGAHSASAAPHFNDIEFDAYLANDRTLGDPEVVRVEPGGRVRLRVINAAAATNFMIDLDRIDGELIAVDGHPIQPIRGSRFGLTTAQRLDILIHLPAGQGAFPIFAIREDDVRRTGIVLATKDGRITRIGERAARREPGLGLSLEAKLVPLMPLVERLPVRTHVLDLVGGHAGGYVWSFSGADFPLVAKRGERVAIVMRNKTDMGHPMHLHGHHFQVTAIDGRRIGGAVRDTVLVPPGRSVTIAFDADNPGEWAFHCHHLYHMVAGMMTTVTYQA